MNWIAVPAKLGPYEVTESGRVRRSDTHREKKITISMNGYAVVALWHKNKGVVCYIHDLVTAAFLGPKPFGACVNHLDGVKSNSYLSNLEYTTQSENIIHAMDMGLSRIRGEGNAAAKLTEDQVRDIHRRAWSGEKNIGLKLQAEYSAGAPIISQIKHGTRWSHLKLNSA